MASLTRYRKDILGAITLTVRIAVSIALFPAALLALFYNYAALILIPQNKLRSSILRSSRFRPQIVIVTGVSTPAGLRVARALYQTGHKVIGVEEIGKTGILHHARWSRAITKFRTIHSASQKHEYIKDLLALVVEERATLWINCSEHYTPQSEAKHVIKSKTSCKCIVPDTSVSENLKTRNDFLDLAQSLRLPTVETHRVRSRNDIHTVLNDGRGKKYILSGPNGTMTTSERAVLPRRTPSQTYQDISQIKITQSKPWLLEQYIDGLQRYSTISIVGLGRLCAFAAFIKTGETFQLLSPTTGLSQAMKTYVNDFVTRNGPRFSGHLCIDFCVDEKTSQSGVVQQTLPVDGRLGTSPALIFFGGKRGSIDLTRAYMACLGSSANGLASFTGLPYNEHAEDTVEPDGAQIGISQLDESVVKLFMIPILQLLVLRIGIRQFLQSLLQLVNRLFFWHDCIYEFWDPLPAFIAYLSPWKVQSTSLTGTMPA